MIKKIYEKVKQIIKDNYKFILFLILFLTILNIPMPYYIDTAGGLIDVSRRVTIENEKPIKGSINISYVTERKGNLLNWAMSYIIPNWDLVKKDKSSIESDSDIEYRDDMMLGEANENAMIVAYQKAGKKVFINNKKIYIISIDEDAKTNLQIGDQVLSVNGITVSSFDEYRKNIMNLPISEKVNLKVIDKNKKYQLRTAKVFEYNGVHVTGILLSTRYTYKTNPKITFHFSSNESGPSGGLMIAMAIYNKLVEENLTNNLVIAGTGTIDINGNVGEIGGIEYKIEGAAKEGADIFFAPIGDNYNDALKVIKKNKYKIKLVPVSTFDEAIDYLENIKTYKEE